MLHRYPESPGSFGSDGMTENGAGPRVGPWSHKWAVDGSAHVKRSGQQNVSTRLSPGLLAPPQPIPDPGRGAGAPRPPRTANGPRWAALRRRGTARPHTAAGEAARAALQPDHGRRTALLQRRSIRPMAGNGRGPGARVSVHMVVICAAPAAARRQDGMARERGQRDQERRSGPAHARTSVPT